ncbi:MAG: MvdC/MvdD family ATP grasp protein [Pseudomonadota bacterium]
MSNVVLMLTTERDVHAQVVNRRLVDLGAEPIFLDTARIPRNVTLSARQSADGSIETELTLAGRTISGAEIAGIWFRRPQQFRPPDNLLFQDECDFVIAECKQALEGWLDLMGDKVMNNPHAENAACNKMLQLARAAEAGLTIPQTLASNDPDAVMAFAADDNCVFKPFTQPGPIIVPTRRLDEAHQPFAHQIRHAPHLYQEEVAKIADIRVNVIDSEVFATSIKGVFDDRPLDWRLDRSHSYAPYDLPVQVAAAIRRFMASIGLRFGALDFGLRADGTLVFFEVNPSGQWLFCEIETGAELSAAMARALTFGTQSTVVQDQMELA